MFNYFQIYQFWHYISLHKHKCMPECEGATATASILDNFLHPKVFMPKVATFGKILKTKEAACLHQMHWQHQFPVNLPLIR